MMCHKRVYLKHLLSVVKFITILVDARVSSTRLFRSNSFWETFSLFRFYRGSGYPIRIVMKTAKRQKCIRTCVGANRKPIKRACTGVVDENVLYAHYVLFRSDPHCFSTIPCVFQGLGTRLLSDDENAVSIISTTNGCRQPCCITVRLRVRLVSPLELKIHGIRTV